jgi:hypothetical protein
VREAAAMQISRRAGRLAAWLAGMALLPAALSVGAIPDARPAPAPGETRAETVDVDARQRVEARRHVPALAVFVSLLVVLSVLLRKQARELETLREKGLFD